MNWKKRLNFYGLPNSIILVILVLSFVATVAEIAGLSMFLPIFEYINIQEAASLEKQSDMQFTKYFLYILDFFNFDTELGSLLILSFSLFLIGKITIFFVNYVKAYFNGVMVKKMSDLLFRDYLSSKPEYYDKVNIGTFSNIVAQELRLAIHGSLVPIDIIVLGISAVTSVVVLFLLSFELTLISFVILLVSSFLPYRWINAVKILGKKNTRCNSAISSFLLSRLRSARLIKLSGTKSAEIDAYTKLIEKQRLYTFNVHILKSRTDLVLEPAVVGISLSMLYLSILYLNLEMSVVFLYMLIILRLIPIIKTLAGQKQSINKSIGAIDAVNELVDGMSKYRDTDKQSELMVNSFNIESIRLDNISYKYTPTAVNALSDISLIFKPSTITAILGPSGSGKSTLVDIISAYRKPTSGSIVINSDTILNVDDKSFTHVFSYLPQDPQIFNGSIFNHIQYGNKFASKEDVYNAAKLSGAYDFISDMSEGFNTLITEDASNLSGGQRQRLDLARVLVRNSPVLILDEPTSGLDPLNEKRFMETIFEIKKMTNKIIIIITHKIETVREVDNIVILEDGKIRNQGNDSYLLKNSDWYATA